MPLVPRYSKCADCCCGFGFYKTNLLARTGHRHAVGARGWDTEVALERASAMLTDAIGGSAKASLLGQAPKEEVAAGGRTEVTLVGAAAIVGSTGSYRSDAALGRASAKIRRCLGAAVLGRAGVKGRALLMVDLKANMGARYHSGVY